jgi:hypothetical protein
MRFYLFMYFQLVTYNKNGGTSLRRCNRQSSRSFLGLRAGNFQSHYGLL